MAEIPPMQIRYLDKAHETQATLWSALLSGEALLIAVAPLLAASASRSVRIPSIALVAVGIIVIWLLIWNFVSTRNVYFKIGAIVSEKRAPSESDVPDANKLSREVRTRERLAIFLLALQGAVLLVTVIRVAYQ